MSHASIQMLMEKLKQLINCNGNIPFLNNRKIRRERPQFQFLYDDLNSIIQSLVSIDQHHDLEKVIDLKKRFKDAAEEAEYIVDLFLSGVHIRSNNGHLLTSSFKPVLYLHLSCVHKRNLDLTDVRRSLKSIGVEFMSIKMDSSLIQSPIPISRSSSVGSKKELLDETVVGLDDDAELIKKKLADDQKKLDVVSIVGMGGIGKTTLATKLFNDRFIMHHFHVRVWVTVSQTYNKRAILLQILEFIRAQLSLEKATDSRLREMVHKNLMGRRYLIVIDDIWDTEAWDNLKLFSPMATMEVEFCSLAVSLKLLSMQILMDSFITWDI